LKYESRTAQYHLCFQTFIKMPKEPFSFRDFQYFITIFRLLDDDHIGLRVVGKGTTNFRTKISAKGFADTENGLGFCATRVGERFCPVATADSDMSLL
jgi:hypothetical protein